jgi:hypothetical protein
MKPLKLFSPEELAPNLKVEERLSRMNALEIE